MATIVFAEKFKPSKIFGCKKYLKELGIEVTEGKYRAKSDWNYENPVVNIPNNRYEVGIMWWDDSSCDVMFQNGVIFGDIKKTDFVVVRKIRK